MAECEEKKVFVIITGGNVDLFSLNLVLERCRLGCTIVAVDRGLETCSKTGITPNVIVGDFDSASTMVVKKYKVAAHIKNIEFVNLEVHKDFTDTQVAVDYAIEHGATEICLSGATGTRIDHTYANIGLLKRCADSGVRAYITDSHNVVTMLSASAKVPRLEGFDYISFIPYGGAVTGVSLRGFEYPAEGITFEIGDSLGISNRIVDDDAEISIGEGYMLMCYSRD